MSAKNQVTKVCEICNKVYSIRFDRKDKSKYCSKLCWASRRKKINCKLCGKEIKSIHAKIYCGNECKFLDMKGENSPKWKDGKSLERDRVRFGVNLKLWRKEVFKKDSYTCQKCGDKKQLHAHHIIGWSENESLRFELENGITLCIGCHGKEHNKDFTKRNNKKCLDCGAKVKMANSRCKPCLYKYMTGKPRRKNFPELEIKVNGTEYKES